MTTINSLDHKTFKSLSRIYMIALGFIACLVLISQIFIQRALSNNNLDAQIINIAGKQRMLSQKISKIILLWNSSLNITRDNKKELNNATAEWSKAHILLTNNLNTLENSPQKTKLTKLFFEVNLEIQELLTISTAIKENIHKQDIDNHQWIKSFLLKEPTFLFKMNQYVYAYEEYASAKIKRIKKIEYFAFTLVILLLLVEFFLLFKPTAEKIKNTLKELINSKDEAVNMAERANIAVKQKNETLEELQLLQKAINQTLLFARIDIKGEIISTGRRLKNILHLNNNIIYENLGLSETDQIKLRNLINARKGTILNHEYQVNLEKNTIEWLNISVFPIIKHQGVIEYLMVCLDITKRKKIQDKNDVLRLDKLKTETALQKSRASLIVEAQEEERKRIAKDIHDSIGQMLTALKFNIESINLNQTEKLNQKIDALKVQTKNIISGVRMATFNLTPPELLDYGIITATQKMVTQLNKFSATEIIFKNETTVDSLRFDNLVETNLYRVTQECINNAIKYANSTYILVTIKLTSQLLSISVTDNGKGFDVNKLPVNPKGGADGGMGLFFMKERMEFINGRLFLNSSINHGTRVVINYPL